MPGNEVGDRVHNFFDQGSLSQDQHHTQFIATNWPGYNNNNIWNTNERQIGGPVNTGPSNFSPQKSDIERGQGNQFSREANGLNFSRQNLRPEFVKNSSQQMNLNGFMHTSQIGQTRNHDSNFGASQSPMNFNNIFNGQHQINGQHGNNNNTRFQQQIILKQMELQRQHQLQQFEAIQRGASNNISSFPNQTARNPFHDGSNHSWPSQVAPNNASWQQSGPSNGFMVSPEMQFMGLIPQQTSQSLYGVPLSSSRSSTMFSHTHIDKPGMLQSSAFKEGNNTSFGQAPSQHIGNTCNLGWFGNVPISEGGGHGFAGGSEPVKETPFSQGSLQDGSKQDAIGLDPDEEKFLFGNNDNIWEGFGGAPHTGSSNTTDLLNGFSSMQNGTWSALMQSAVAETSSTDGGVHEEGSGLGPQSGGPHSASQHPSISNNNDVKIHSANSNANYVNSLEQQQRFHNTFLHNNVGQKSQPSSLSFIGPVQANSGIGSNNRDMLMDTSRGVMRVELVTDSNIKVGISNASSAVDYVTPGLTNMKVDLESSQKLSNNRHLEQRNLNVGPSMSESSDKKDVGGAEVDGRENGDRRESYSDNRKGFFHPNASNSYGANRRSLDPLSTNINDMEGRVSNYQGNMFSSFVRSGDISSSNQHLSPSQNMLELLHKVDQSKERNSASHFSSIDDKRLSNMPVNGVHGPSQNNLFTSNGFDLQLAPPSQVVSPSNLSNTIQSSSITTIFPSTSHLASQNEDKHACLTSCPTTSQQTIEAFHHLENQSNTPHNTYSMPQTQTTKNIGFDPNHCESKRLKGQDGNYDSKQIIGHETTPIASTTNNMSQPSVTSGNAKMWNFSHQNTVSFVQNNPQKVSSPNVTISEQMDPSGFDQSGTLKYGPLLPGNNVSRVPMKNDVSGTSHYNLVGHNSNDNVSSLHHLVPHVSVPSPGSMRAKKRKTATSELIPWNKEIGQCLKRLQNLSSAEVDWAKSSNRLIEKVEDEIDYNEDLISIFLPKKRLLLTTQLLQQVLKPPSVFVLSRDASFVYELMIYSLARLELGDACSLICGLETNLPVENANPLNGKVKTSERIQEEYFLKVVEDFVSRKKELENGLLRLEKRASILDLRLDCQDLERFSVINRFARFHGRAQFSGPETSSSSDTNATSLKPYPQRYVSAHPMPMNVPEIVQCLSL